MSLRIISRPAAISLQREIGARAIDAGSLKDSYNARLTKLLPGEAMVAYPLFLTAAQKVSQEAAAAAQPVQAAAGSLDIKVAVLSWVMLLVVIVLRWRATRTAAGSAQWPAVLISAVSFVIWVYVLRGSFGLEHYFSSFSPDRDFYASLFLFAWTTLAPALYTGDPA